MAYQREKAVAYAHRWAYGRNPNYLSFNGLGGDCTNFISQCIYAGGARMNYKPTFGWYYKNGRSKAPAWTGVEYLYRFLTKNTGPGPYAAEVDIREVAIADVIQLSFDGVTFGHSLFVVSVGPVPNPENVLIATHTNDSDYRPLASYSYSKYRCLHILGAR